jgi:hypothetical protein
MARVLISDTTLQVQIASVTNQSILELFGKTDFSIHKKKIRERIKILNVRERFFIIFIIFIFYF